MLPVAPWNLVVRVAPGASSTGVFECLSDFGRVRPGESPGLFLLHADDPVATLRQLRLLRRMNPALGASIERIVPLTETFAFASEDELAERARHCIEQWQPRLAGKRVHIDHARDATEPGCAEAGVLAHILSGLLDKAGLGDGDSPDVYLTFDCCDAWAGLSLWSRALRDRYPELGLRDPETSLA